LQQFIISKYDVYIIKYIYFKLLKLLISQLYVTLN
jgi:hypothetical protein